MKGPASFIDVVLIGSTNGAVYGLIALGYTLVYGILQLINFAHGDVFALGGLLASTMILDVFTLEVSDSTGVTLLGIAGTLVVSHRVRCRAQRRSRAGRLPAAPHAPRLAPLITAVGMSFILQNVGLYFWGVNFQSIPNLIPQTDVFDIGGVDYQWNKLTVILMTIPLLLFLTWLVRSTRQGKAMRATSQDPRGSGDDGHQREPHDLVHVRARGRAGRRGRVCSTS